MTQWIATILAALLALGGLCSPTISWAKPPDLPGDVLQRCPEGRERQQEEGFSTRPEATEPQLPAVRERKSDTAEEQEAPPALQQIRVPTERRRAISVQPERVRERSRPTEDELRRREMLRTTEPLETQPQRPREACEVVQDGEFEPVQYYEVPDPRSPGPLAEKPRRIPRADKSGTSIGDVYLVPRIGLEDGVVSSIVLFDRRHPLTQQPNVAMVDAHCIGRHSAQCVTDVFSEVTPFLCEMKEFWSRECVFGPTAWFGRGFIDCDGSDLFSRFR